MLLEHRRRQLSSTPWQSLLWPRVLLENASSSTRENALFTIRMLVREAPSLNRLVVVTSRFHQRRACATFRRVAATTPGAQQLQIECAQMPPSLAAPAPCVNDFGEPACCHECDADETYPRGASVGLASELLLLTVRELLATMLYRARGWV